MQSSSLLILCLLSFYCHSAKTERSFAVDYENNQFIKDGKPFRYMAGVMHYYQVPCHLWRERLIQLRGLGFDAVQTYISWNWHEREKGIYDFAGCLNFTEYFQIAQSLNLLVILRAGPFIDAEQDSGAFPAWLQNYEPELKFRTADPRFMAEVDKWCNMAFPMIKPFLYPNGGPIIMIQLDNEYSSYCDKVYLNHLLAVYKKHFGDKGIVYFSVDNYNDILKKCKIADVLSTVDFGPTDLKNVENHFKNLRVAQPKGPLVNSEFYSGWFDTWKGGHSRGSIDGVVKTMEYMYNMNASFVLYAAHGGTNFGYQAGSYCFHDFKPLTTSYDFDAPISESGVMTPKYFAIRQTVEKLNGKKIPYPIPQSTEVFWYGEIEFRSVGTIFDLLSNLSPPPIEATYPLSAEAVGQNYGFIMYETKLPSITGKLNISGTSDRAYIFINGKLQKIYQRTLFRTTVSVKSVPGAKMQILIENQGRICSTYLNDRKGLIENVTINGTILTNWKIYKLNFARIIQHQNLSSVNNMKILNSFIPSIYIANFTVSQNAGPTYLDLSGWGKGQAFTGENKGLGRYWPTAGPQVTLYHPFVKQGVNKVVLFELEKPGNCKNDTCHARLINYPIYK